MRKTVLILTEKFQSRTRPDKEAVRQAVAAWLAGALKT